MSDRDSFVDDFTFRRARDDDVTAITRLNLRLAAETEDKALAPDTLRRGVSRGFLQFPEVQYFVAEHGHQVIGQLMLTREWSDWRDGWMLWLQSVYVVQPLRRQGVFRRLLQYALATVGEDTQAIGLRLYVERENAAAIAAYKRLGFDDAGYSILEIVPLSDDAFSALPSDNKRSAAQASASHPPG